MVLYNRLFLNVSFFITITYFIIHINIFSKTLMTNISNKRKISLNMFLILITCISIKFFSSYNVRLYSLGVILSARLLGLPYSILAVIIISIYRFSLGVSSSLINLEVILLGIISASYNLNILKKINYRWRDLLVSLVLAVSLNFNHMRLEIFGEDIIIYTTMFFSSFTVISNYKEKLDLIKDRDDKLKDISLTCNSLTGLHQINEQMSSNFNLQETYDSLIEIGCQQLGVTTGGLLLLEEEILDLKYIKGLDRAYLKKMRLKDGDSCLTQLLEDGQSVIINQLQEYECEDMNLFIKDNFKSMLIVPIITNDKVGGIIFFLHHEENFFSNRDLIPIQTIAKQAPLVIKKGQFFERMEHNVASLSTLQRTSKTITSTLNLEEVFELTIDVIMGTMGFSIAALFLLDEQKEELNLVSSSGIPDNFEKEKLIANGKSIAWQTISNDAPLIINKLDQEVKATFNRIDLMSVVSIPLKVRDKTIGTINAAQIGFKRNFNEADKSFLTTLANQIAIAIENARMYNEMEEVATKDGLTKLYNHSHFQDLLKQEIKKAKQNHHSLSLLMLDVDNFKEFNDTYGHQLGDKVLSKLAKVLQNSVREADIVARYGGEEFVIILPKTGLEGAIKIGKRINQLVKKMTITYDELELKVTVSIGSATYQYGQSKKAFINIADQALYKAKNNGKDQICII